jgi:hypothetical protein
MSVASLYVAKLYPIYFGARSHIKLKTSRMYRNTFGK